jgi:hypothetical protein
MGWHGLLLIGHTTVLTRNPHILKETDLIYFLDPDIALAGMADQKTKASKLQLPLTGLPL